MKFTPHRMKFLNSIDGLNYSLDPFLSRRLNNIKHNMSFNKKETHAVSFMKKNPQKLLAFSYSVIFRGGICNRLTVCLVSGVSS